MSDTETNGSKDSMKIGIMQPYFFPYIGYFQLMNYVDQWIVFDQVQFIDKGWINRNRILHPDARKEWQFITVPLKKRGQFTNIQELRINTDQAWVDNIMGKLSAYKKAPYFEQTRDFVRDCLLEHQDESLSQLLVMTLSKTARELGINTPINVQSEMKLNLPEITHPGQWALEISKKLNAHEYINPTGGSEIFNEDEFKGAGISLRFLKPELSSYVQRRGFFTPGLSIIDVMMWNDRSTIQEMLNLDYKILTKQEIDVG